ncbi:putative AT-hook motif nuclear-localized protein [Helianthus debilis subsp. tardiflorus]
MDVREGMASFYVDRGVSGSGNQSGGGVHTPPSGFKIQPNPSLHSGQTNMWLTKMGSPSYPHGITTGGSSGGGGDGSDSVVKKKRGRPRKYAPNESHMELGLTPAPLSGSGGSGSPNPRKNRGRPPGSGWKQRLANVGEWMNSSAGLAFTPHTIHVSAGEDVAEKILIFARQRARAICILSGSGTVSAVTLSQFTSSGGTVTYEGRFEILCLSGCYLLSENSGSQGRTGGLSISVCSADGNVIGGAIGGRLVASSSVQVMLCSFVYGGGSDVKAKTKTETSSRDEKRLDIQLNETSPEAVHEQQISRVGLRNSPTEIDLTR